MIQKKELIDIVNVEQLKTFLKEKGYQEKQYADALLCCPRYYDNENKISVLYGKFIIGYSSQQGLELLYILDTADNVYSWAKNDSVLLVCQYDHRLAYYDLATQNRKDLIRNVQTISPIAENGTFILGEAIGSVTWLYDLEHNKFTKICKNMIGYPEYQISPDNQYLLWRDNIPVMTQEFDILYIVDLESGKKIRLKTWGFDTPVYGMTWNQANLKYFAIGGMPDIMCLIFCVVSTLLWARIAAKFANKVSAVTLNRAIGVVLAVLGVVILIVNIMTKQNRIV